jgi:HEAT repeat protein
LVNGRVQLAPLIPEASDIWWRDVFEILVGLHQDPQGLLLDLIDRDAFLAANYLQYVANPVRQTCQEALVDALVEEFWKESSARKTAIIEHLGQIEHPRAGQALLQILHREWSSMVLLAALEGLAVWGRGQVDAQKAICDAEESIFHSFGATVGRIGELLSWCWSDQIPDDWDWTPQIKFLRDRGKPLRARALVALGLGLKRIDGVDHELLQLLKARNTDEELAWCTIEALALLRPKQEIYDWARKSAKMKDRSSQLQRRRARAVYLLGLVGRDSETERLLRGALRDSQNPHVRGSAVMGMARLDLIDARTEIEALMSSETNPWVLRQAAEALGQIGNLDTLPVLQRYLRRQQASNRRIVRRAINEILERNAMQPSLV